MVGVPRSKGCRICVQRRIKCDQTRPTCNNCKKGNRPCPGYAQDLKFQDEGERLRKRYPQTASSIFEDYSAALFEDLPDFTSSVTTDTTTDVAIRQFGSEPFRPDSKDWDVIGLDIDESQRRTFLGLLEGKSEQYIRMVQESSGVDFLYQANSDTPRNAHNFGFTNVDHSASLLLGHINSPNLAQNQMIMKFRDSIVPGNETVIPEVRSHAKWLAHLPPLTGTNHLLDTAVRAVTLVHIGRLNNSEPFVNESRPYYGQALRLLNNALQDRKNGMSNETLCATILLSFYEMFASDNNESWVRHAGGVSALMKARGPQAHRHGLGREIFLAYRYTLIIEAFQQDVPCFLAEPGWMKVSSEIHADLVAAGAAAAIRAERAEVFDLSEEYYQSMVILPEYAANARALWQAKQAGTPPPISRAQVLEKLTQSRAIFKSTFSRFEAALKKTGHAPTINLNHKDPLIGLDYEFINTFVSATYMGYWTVLVVLNLCLMGLQADDPEMVVLYATENRESSLNICRSCKSMLTSSFLGPFFLIFGLRVGLLVFEDTGGVECDWILRKLFEIGDKHMGIAKHVPGYRAGIGVEQLLIEFKARKTKAAEQLTQHTHSTSARQGPSHDTELQTTPSISISIENDDFMDITDPSSSSIQSESFSTTSNLNNGLRPHQQQQQYNTPTPSTNPSSFSNASTPYSSSGPFTSLTDLDNVIEAWENQDLFPLNPSSNPSSTSHPSSRAHSATPFEAQYSMTTDTTPATSAQAGSYQPSPFFAGQGPQYLFADDTQGFLSDLGVSTSPNQNQNNGGDKFMGDEYRQQQGQEEGRNRNRCQSRNLDQGEKIRFGLDRYFN